MNLKTRLGVTVYLPTLFVFSLIGCTTVPDSEVSQRPNVEEGQSNGETLVFATSKFSITSPPVIWRTIKERKTVISWKNRITGSVIYVQAIAPVNISNTALANKLVGAISSMFEDKHQKASVSLEGQGQASFNGRGFYQVVMNYDITTIVGVREKGKILIYLLETEDFLYSLSLTSAIGFYDEDRPILENLAKRVRYLE